MTLVLTKTLFTIALLLTANCVTGAITICNDKAQFFLRASAATLAISGLFVALALLWVA